MPRELCPTCHYPKVTCICDSITTYDHKTQITILQHPSEVTNKKNTVRLLELACSSLSTVIGETSEDFAGLKKQISAKPEQYALLYPSDKAKTWQQATTDHPSLNNLHLIVIDGTWRKAKKILAVNPWLNEIPHLTLETHYESQYGIRKTNIEGGLSTLEAVAYMLEQIEQINPKPLLDMLGAFKTAFTKLMPDNIKQRYR